MQESYLLGTPESRAEGKKGWTYSKDEWDSWHAANGSGEDWQGHDKSNQSGNAWQGGKAAS
eukprot:11884607-Karenia_brevis.AAC.1